MYYEEELLVPPPPSPPPPPPPYGSTRSDMGLRHEVSALHFWYDMYSLKRHKTNHLVLKCIMQILIRLSYAVSSYSAECHAFPFLMSLIWVYFLIYFFNMFNTGMFFWHRVGR